MPISPELELLTALVRAHEEPLPATKHREPITVFHVGGRNVMQHHAFGATGAPEADDTLLEDLHTQGLISIEYHDHTWLLTPTKLGRSIVAEIERAHQEEPKADVDALISALEGQRASDNKLAWAAVRPVLEALRRYWENAGFPIDGIGMMPLLASIPDGTEGQFQATIRSLLKSGYLSPAADIEIHGMPAFVSITEQTHAVLDGWPGTTSQEVVENLLAVLAERAAQEPDSEKRRRLERVGSALRELGVSTASEVLAKVLMGPAGG